METKIQFWLNDFDLEKIFSGSYWNNEEEEKKKDWYILNGNSQKLIEYLEQKTTCRSEFGALIGFAYKLGLPVKGAGLDLAAGVCWATALLSRIEAVDIVYATEISKHRLLRIAPHVLDLFDANSEKVIRVLGSFYDIKLPDQSIDFCFMSQAFHHADEPYRLIAEVKRVLKPSGIVLLIGENPIYRRDYLKAYLKNLIKLIVPLKIFCKRPVYKFFPRFKELYPTDTESGDHYYRIQDYSRMFQQAGFRLLRNKENKFTGFLAVKQDYFDLK